MVRLHTVVSVVTSVAACGSTPSAPQPAPQQPPSPLLAQPVALDAAVPDAPESPRLVCNPGTAIAVAPAPEPTWFCASPDGTRNGLFVTQFPDGSTEIAGSYADGRLDGPWERRAATGAIVEAGSYAAGQKTGRWRMTRQDGALLGEYEMRAGTGIEKHWLDDGTLYRERALKAGVPNGPEKIYARDGTPVVSARWTAGKLDGPHTVGTKGTLRIEETFAAGVRRGRRQIWQFWQKLLEESYDRHGRIHGEYTVWRSRKVKRLHGSFDHGKRDGLWVWNDRDGNKERQGNYLGGMRDGPWTEWYENKIVFTGSYARGKPHGDFIHYDRNQNELGRFKIRGGTGTLLTFWAKNKVASRQQLHKGAADGPYQELTSRGKLVVEGAYQSDVKHGTWKEWTPEGVPTLEQTWKRGRLDGVVRKYIDGKISTEATYKDGRAWGPYTEYRDGKRALTGELADDRRTGTWTTYDVEGRVRLVATYQAGVLDGPWRQLTDGIVLEGTMTQGRRTGRWTQTDRAGTVRDVTYPAP